MKILILAAFCGLTAVALAFVPAARPGSSSYGAQEDLAEIFAKIKKIVTTSQGLQAIKGYAATLDTDHPVVFLVKAFIENTDDTTLSEMLFDMFSGVDAAQGSVDVSQLGELFKRAKEIVDTAEGLQVVKNYVKELRPQNAIVQRIQGFIIVAKDQNIREVLDALFSGLSFVKAAPAYSEAQEFIDIFSKVKAIGRTKEGVAAVRGYVATLDPTDPHLFLVKAFIEGADDATLQEILEDMLANIPLGPTPLVTELGSLLKRARTLIDSASGLALFKQYVDELRPQHPIVARIKAAISSASDDRIREIMDGLLGNVFFAAAAPGYSADKELEEIFGQIRAIGRTKEGVDAVRAYAQRLDASNEPNIFLVKAFIEGSDDATLQEILEDMLANIPVAENAHVTQLATLVKRARQLVDSAEGLSSFKGYVDELRPAHPIVIRIKAAIVSASDERIRQLLDVLLSGVNYYYVAQVNYGAKEDLHSIFSQIKAIVSTQEGLDVVKEYARNLDAADPIIFLVKAFIEGADDATLRALLEDMFAGITYYPAYADVSDLRDLFSKAKAIVATAEGLQAFKEYVNNLRPQHPIVQRIQEVVRTASDERIREVLAALFSGINYYSAPAYYSVAEELREIFVQIKAIVSTQEGLDAVKEYASNLEAADPITFLVKAFIEGADDATLRALLEDMFSGINYYIAFADVSQLRSLFKRAQAIVKTPEGLAAFKQYVDNLRPQHPIVQRIQEVVRSADDARISQVLDALFGGLDYYYSVQYQAVQRPEADFDHILESIKVQLGTEEGLKAVKAYAQKLHGNHPVTVLVRTYIEEASHDQLAELLQELLKPVKDISKEHSYPASLEELVRQLKVFVLSEGNYAVAVRVYLYYLQSDHQVVQKIQQYLTLTSDDALARVLEQLFEPIQV